MEEEEWGGRDKQGGRGEERRGRGIEERMRENDRGGGE